MHVRRGGAEKALSVFAGPPVSLRAGLVCVCRVRKLRYGHQVSFLQRAIIIQTLLHVRRGGAEKALSVFAGPVVSSELGVKLPVGEQESVPTP